MCVHASCMRMHTQSVRMHTIGMRMDTCAHKPNFLFWLFSFTCLASVSFSPLPVCVLKILSIFKRKNSGLIPHWKMSVS